MLEPGTLDFRKIVGSRSNYRSADNFDCRSDADFHSSYQLEVVAVCKERLPGLDLVVRGSEQDRLEEVANLKARQRAEGEGEGKYLVPSAEATQKEEAGAPEGLPVRRIQAL